ARRSRVHLRPYWAHARRSWVHLRPYWAHAQGAWIHLRTRWAHARRSWVHPRPLWAHVRKSRAHTLSDQANSKLLKSQLHSTKQKRDWHSTSNLFPITILHQLPTVLTASPILYPLAHDPYPRLLEGNLLLRLYL